MDTSLLPLAVAVIGGIVWAVRLEGKVNRHDDRIFDLEETAFNPEAFQEFEKRIESDLRNIKDSIGEVKSEIRSLKKDLKVP
jgi:hypothetical protein